MFFCVNKAGVPELRLNSTGLQPMARCPLMALQLYIEEAMRKSAMRLLAVICWGMLFFVTTQPGYSHTSGTSSMEIQAGASGPSQSAAVQAAPTPPPVLKPNPTPPKPKSSPTPSPCAHGEQVSLGVLSGDDADALARTLSSVQQLDLVVTAIAQKNTGATDDKPPKDTLCAKSRDASPVSPATKSELMALVKVFDTDQFKGVGLNSNFIVSGKDLPNLSSLIPHPTVDLDLKGPMGSDPLYVVAPSTLLLGRSPGALAQHAAKVKRDLLLLQAQVDVSRHEVFGTWTPWLASHTVLLEVITPPSAKLILEWALSHRVNPAGQQSPAFREVVARSNYSVMVLPQGTNLNDPLLLQAQALERNVLATEQKNIEDVLKLSPAGGTGGKDGSSASANTSTSSTIKTTITQASVKNPVTIATTTIPATGPAGSSSGGASSPGSGAGNTGGSAGSGGAGGSGQGSSAGQSSQAGNGAPANFQMDRIIRLYHLRDATGIASAINTLNAGIPGARPLVQALSDNGTNDLIQILPPPSGQDYAEDVARAIALLDLPRPQVAMQVWSYQISAEVNPKKNYTSGNHRLPPTIEDDPMATAKTGSDEAKAISTQMGNAVKEANFRMRLALQNAMAKIYDQARNNPNFFDPAFQHYLTDKYEDCIQQNKYCLGYYDALQVPAGDSSIGRDASLGRLLLFMAAARDNEYAANQLHILIVNAMNDPSLAYPALSNVCEPGELSFDRFRNELETLAETSNLRTLRAALLDFFFQYKWTLNYPKDFVPYDLQHSAHRLDDLFQPLIQAFDDDIDDYVQACLDKVTNGRRNKAGLSSFGTTRVAALSGTQAVVSGQISNYFDITQTPALSTVAQALLGGGSGNNGGGSGGNGGGSSNNSSSGSTNGAGSNSSTSSSTSTGGGDSSGSNSSGGNSSNSGNSGGSGGKLPATVGNFFAANQIAAVVAAANIISPQQVTTQLTRGMSLTITPVSLDTASSAELNVIFSVNETDAPQSVDSPTAKHDLLDRVATHAVTTKVRVESLRLFELSTFSMKISHPQTPTCLPSFDDGGWGKAGTVAVNIPFAPVCAVWRSVFGSMPGANRLFSWPQNPKIIDNRSVAVVRAVVVPTAMDLGLNLRFENDRVLDPLTNSKVSLNSTRQLDGRVRPFHKVMMSCVVDGKDRIGNPADCDAITLQNEREDYRQK